jgi:hypothetical protein
MSKINIKLTNNSTYAEEFQVNPLRWKCLIKTGENEFKDQSGWWICKDFLNDCVAFFESGHKFSIYGWKNDLVLQPEGMYFLLDNLADKQLFVKNLEVINKKLEEQLQCKVDFIDLPDADQAIVLIPTQCWKSTYLISTITLLIRLSNYDKQFKTWEDFWKPNSILAMDKNIFGMPEAGKFINKYGFIVPEQFQKYWYYAGIENSVKNPKPTYNSVIHNCGIVTWVQWMNKELNKKEKVAA